MKKNFNVLIALITKSKHFLEQKECLDSVYQKIKRLLIPFFVLLILICITQTNITAESFMIELIIKITYKILVEIILS